MTTVLYFPKTEEEEEKNEIFWRNQASCNEEEWKWLSWSYKKEIRERRGRKNCFMTWCDWNWDHVAVLFLPLLFWKRQFPLKEKNCFPFFREEFSISSYFLLHHPIVYFLSPAVITSGGAIKKNLNPFFIVPRIPSCKKQKGTSSPRVVVEEEREKRLIAVSHFLCSSLLCLLLPFPVCVYGFSCKVKWV